jgi:hypothetical protein
MGLPRQVLYELNTGRVLMNGYCDFTKNAFYDETLHGIIENDVFVFTGGCSWNEAGEEVFWYYDADNEAFIDTPPGVD